MAERQPQAPDLVDRVADWGVTVSEARAKKGFAARSLATLAGLLVFAGAILVLPILAGTLLRFEAQGVMAEIAVVASIVFVGVLLKRRAARLPRNALQIDYRAAELRFGSERSDGVFVRQRVASFRDIGAVSVSDDGALCLQIRSETLALRFNEADGESLERLASQIAAARESARRAPIRSRIQSRIMGVEASIREVKSRLTSRTA